MLFGSRNIQRRIRIEEVTWFQCNRDNLRRHNREIFNSRKMGETEGMPYNNVFVLGVFFGSLCDEGFDSATTAGLVGEFPARIEFAVFVFGEPDGVVSEFGTTGVEGGGIS